MRVMLYRLEDGRRKAIVVPDRGARLAPITVRGIDREVHRQQISEVVALVVAAENKPRSE